MLGKWVAPNEKAELVMMAGMTRQHFGGTRKNQRLWMGPMAFVRSRDRT